MSPSPGVRQLVAGGEGTTIVLQVPARIGGLSDTARFARNLAAAASEFGEWCETQNRTRSYSPSVGYRVTGGWEDEIRLDEFSRDCSARRKRRSPLILPDNVLAERWVEGSALKVLGEVLTWEEL